MSNDALGDSHNAVVYFCKLFVADDLRLTLSGQSNVNHGVKLQKAHAGSQLGQTLNELNPSP